MTRIRARRRSTAREKASVAAADPAAGAGGSAMFRGSFDMSSMYHVPAFLWVGTGNSADQRLTGALRKAAFRCLLGGAAAEG